VQAVVTHRSFELCAGACTRLGLGDVEQHAFDAARRGSAQRLSVGITTNAGEHTITTARQIERCGAANSARCPRHEHGAWLQG